LEEAADTNLYVIDVGVEQPRNVSLGQIQLARQVFAKSRGLKLQATVRLQSPGEDAESLRVKMYVEQSGGQQPLLVDGRMIEFDKEWLADQQVVVSPGKPATVELGSAARKITQLGTHHGRVQIVDAADGLPVDDERHFTIRVREAWPVLVVAPDDVDQQWFVDALAPEIARRENQAEYDITTLSPQEFERTPGAQLARFAAVALLDPPPLADVSWRKLVEYVRAGGGVALFLGRNARFDSFNGQEAQRLLPGKLIGKRRARPTQPWYLSVDGSHPVTQPFAAYKTQDLWRDMPVRQHWWFRPLQPEADIFLRYTNGYPAALETRLGQGRVITLTTPVSDSANRPDWWNRIPTAYANDWIFVVLADSIVQHVIQADNVVLNYQVGGAAMVELPDDTGPQRFTLFTPSDEEKKVTRSEGRLAIELAGRPGAYRLKPIDDSGDVLGVTANLPPAASDLTRAPRARLDEILGEENYSYSTGVTEIERQISSVRGGRRLYDYLLLLLALIVGLEHLLSNRFYRRQAQHARTAAPSMA